MSQIDHILDTLKKNLKANGVTYAQVAANLDLSEASVKRLFSERSVSLDRLEQICNMVGMQISDLILTMEGNRRQLSQLTDAQENELVANKELLLVAHLVVNGWQYPEILEHYRFDEPKLIACLIKLQKTGILELLPLNKIKLRISSNFSWIRNGPVQQFFKANFMEDFFRSKFSGKDEELHVMSGMLTPASAKEFAAKLKALETYFVDLTRQDSRVPVSQRHNVGCVLALRPWYAELYNQLRKPNKV